MFKGFKVTPIKVFSCAKHNNAKSPLDNALVKGLLMPLEASDDPLPQDVRNAVNLAKHNFPEVKNYARTEQLVRGMGFDTTGTLFDPSVDVYAWLRQLTAAIVFHGRGFTYDETIVWDDARVWSVDFRRVEYVGEYNSFDKKAIPDLIAPLAEERKSDALDWLTGWQRGTKGYPEEIYRFDLYFTDDLINIRHTFYSSFIAFVSFKASAQTINLLKRRAGTSSGKKDEMQPQKLPKTCI